MTTESGWYRKDRSSRWRNNFFIHV